MMIEEAALDKNIFPQFPQNEKHEGYLIFGGYDTAAFKGAFPEVLFSQIIAPLNVTKGIC
jgi:hypothetical protein